MKRMFAERNFRFYNMILMCMINNSNINFPRWHDFLTSYLTQLQSHVDLIWYNTVFKFRIKLFDVLNDVRHAMKQTWYKTIIILYHQPFLVCRRIPLIGQRITICSWNKMHYWAFHMVLKMKANFSSLYQILLSDTFPVCKKWLEI